MATVSLLWYIIRTAIIIVLVNEQDRREVMWKSSLLSLAAREHRFNFRIYRQDLTTVQGVAAYSASSVRSSSSCRAASKAAWTLGATAGPS